MIKTIPANTKIHHGITGKIKYSVLFLHGVLKPILRRGPIMTHNVKIKFNEIYNKINSHP